MFDKVNPNLKDDIRRRSGRVTPPETEPEGAKTCLSGPLSRRVDSLWRGMRMKH